MIYAKILAALAVVAVVYFGWQTYANAIAEAERLTGELKTANASAAAWQRKKEHADREIERRDATISERDAAKSEVAKRLSNALAELDALKRTDQTTREWANNSLPPAIVSRLRPDSTSGTARTRMPNRPDAPNRTDGTATPSR